MDFFKDVKAKLKELEELSQMTEEHQQQQLKELFGGGRKGKAGSQASRPMVNQRRPQQPKQRQRPNPQKQQKKRVRQPVDSPSCPVEEITSRHQPTTAGDTDLSIFDNLGERLDEAFLLQEVLGPPRCVREWE